MFPSSAPSPTTVLGLVFAGSAAYSCYHLYTSLARSSGASSSSRVLPPTSLTESALVEVLREITQSVSGLAGEVTEALSLHQANSVESATGVEEDARRQGELELHGRGLVQGAVAAAQKRVFSAHAVSESEVAGATAYYTTGAGRSRVVVEALGEFKGLVGRYFVTKASLLSLMERSHELNASAIKDALGSAWDRGIIKHPSQIDRFLSNPSIQASMKGAIEKFFELEVGMSVDELEELSQKPRYTEVSVWGGRIRYTSVRRARVLLLFFLGSGRSFYFFLTLFRSLYIFFVHAGRIQSSWRGCKGCQPKEGS